MQIEAVWLGFGLTIGLNLLGLAVAYGRITTRLDYGEERWREHFKAHDGQRQDLRDLRQDLATLAIRPCPILPRGRSNDGQSNELVSP